MGLSGKEFGRTMRKARIRKKISGTPERPRFSIFRSSRFVYAQIVDDLAGRTLVACSSKEKGFGSLKGKANVEAAKAVGKELAARAQAKKIATVVFDRNGFIYHGRVKALADSAREAGLKF